MSDADVDFLDRELWWRTYTTQEALSTTRRVELVGKKEFAAAELDPKYETYVVYVGSVSFVASLSSFPLDVYPSRRPQIAGLIAKEAPTKVLAEYANFADVFSPDLVSKLPKHTGINDHAIELVDSQQLPWPVELETLKAYIETNLANRFISPSKSPLGAPILFDRRLDGSFRLCV